MPEYEVTVSFSNAGDRNTVRMRVVDAISKEVEGRGKDEAASRYTYYVETVQDGRRIYLRRPAFLHNGFDFVVCVEGVNFNPGGRKRNNPSHNDVLYDLRCKAAESREAYHQLFTLIDRVYHCEDVDFDSANNIRFAHGFPCDMILAVLKWLFIEQDIRYWSYSGRAMLWGSIAAI